MKYYQLDVKTNLPTVVMYTLQREITTWTDGWWRI